MSTTLLRRLISVIRTICRLRYLDASKLSTPPCLSAGSLQSSSIMAFNNPVPGPVRLHIRQRSQRPDPSGFGHVAHARVAGSVATILRGWYNRQAVYLRKSLDMLAL